ncbi:MAG: hypothetical protein CVV41_02820 [Candidatus Riflebacteria bacterium HGW-Riflebacteria-1]|nr:MAG: hypothetical protein CVV41_02820 [Candidatus Riflebacteria bacterium HGW-Riflebacteria-1]
MPDPTVSRLTGKRRRPVLCGSLWLNWAFLALFVVWELSLAGQEHPPTLHDHFERNFRGDPVTQVPEMIPPLHKAALKGNLTLVKALLENGADVNARNKDGSTLLDILTHKRNSLPIIELLTRYGAANSLIDPKRDPDEKDSSGTPLLMRATLSKSPGAMEYLLARGANVDAENSAGETSLTIALQQHDCEILWLIPLLLEAGADANHRVARAWTPLHLIPKFCASPFDPKLYLKHGADPNLLAEGGLSPLMEAMSHPHHIYFAFCLLEAGANLHARDERGRLPIHYAARNANLEGIILARELGANLNATDSQGFSPLHWAVAERIWSTENHAELVEYLLDQGLDPNLPANDGTTPVVLADKSRQQELAFLLVQRGANPPDVQTIVKNWKQDRQSGTPLHQAAREGRALLVRELLKVLPRERIEETDGNGWQALQVAVRSHQAEVATLLLRHGLDPNRKMANGRTALHHAVDSRSSELVALLLEFGARADLADDKGVTPLMLAEQGGDPGFLALLERAGPQLSGETASGTAIIQQRADLVKAMVDKRWVSVRRLLRAGAPADGADARGNTLLMLAMSHQKWDIVNELLAMDVPIRVANSDGVTALHLAAKGGRRTLLRNLLARGAPVDAEDNAGRTPLFSALEKPSISVLEVLTNAGANLNHRDGKGKTPLAVAAEGGHKSTTAFMFLGRRGANPNLPDKEGNTLAFFAVRHQRVDLLKRVLALGGDIRAINAEGWSPLVFGLVNGPQEVREVIWQCRPDLAERAPDGRSVMHYWVRGGDLQLIHQGLQSGISVETRDQAGRSLLFEAAEGGLASVTRLLLDRGANVNATNLDGRSLLGEAIRHGQAATMELLVAAGADTGHRDRDGLTPLLLAASKPDLFLRLLDLGARADFSALTNDALQRLRERLLFNDDLLSKLVQIYRPLTDLAPLFDLQSPQAFRTVFRWGREARHDLLEAGLSLGFPLVATDTIGDTLMHAVARTGASDTLRLLLHRGGSIEVRNSNGETPLLAALQDGNIANSLFLLEAGSSATPSTVLYNSTPLHWAAIGSSTEVIGQLIEHGADLEAQDLFSATPLFWAVEKGNIEAVRILLEHGARTDVQETFASSSTQVRSGAVMAEFRAPWFSHSPLQADKNGFWGHSPLFRALWHGNAPVAEALLIAGASISFRDLAGNNALHVAVRHGSADLINRLISLGISPDLENEKGLTPMIIADQNGNLSAVEALLANGAKFWTFPPPASEAEHDLVPLHDAAARNRLARIQWLHARGWPIDQRDPQRRTPLECAILAGKCEAAQLLLTLGASPDQTTCAGEPLISLAVRNGQEEIAFLLAKNHADLTRVDLEGNTPLHVAICERRYRCAGFFLGQSSSSSAVDNLGRNPLHELLITGDEQDPLWRNLLSLLSRSTKPLQQADRAGLYPLHHAAERRGGDTNRFLLDRGADPDALDLLGRTPLFHAVRAGNLEALSVLLERSPDLGMRSLDGESPCSLADHLGRAEALVRLINAGAASASFLLAWPDIDSSGRCPLHHAATENRLEAVRFLLLKGADLHQRDHFGETPLFGAIRSGAIAVVALLLKNGADLDARNSCGEHARDLGASVFREGGDIDGQILSHLPPDHPDRRFLREAAGKSLWKTLESLATPHVPSLSPNLK